MSVTITSNPNDVFLSGNPALFKLAGTEAFNEYPQKGTTELTLPFPAIYEEYSVETDPAFRLSNTYFTCNFYAKNNPSSNGYDLNLAANFASLALYLADCVTRLKKNPYLAKYYLISTNGTKIILQARSTGTEYAITAAALRLLGVSRTNSDYHYLWEMNPFYKLGLSILKNNDGAIDIEKSPLPGEMPDPYHFNCENTFDISKFIYKHKTNHFAYPHDGSGVLNHGLNIYDSIVLIPSENYGNPQTVHPGLASKTYYALAGKLSDEKWRELRSKYYADFLDYITTGNYTTRFLTDCLSPKTIDIYQPERLYWFPLPGASIADNNQYKVMVTMHFEGNHADATLQIGETQTVVTYGIMEIPCNYRIVRALANFKITSYDVFVTNTNNDVRSTVFSFIIDRKYQKNARYFLAQNAYGVYDCFRLTGEAQKVSEVKEDIIDVTNNETDRVTTDRLQQINESKTSRFKINTGYKSKLEIAWIVDLDLSRHTVIIKGSNYYPVKFFEGKFPIDADGQPFENCDLECELETDLINSASINMPILPDSAISGHQNSDDTAQDFDEFSFFLTEQPVEPTMAIFAGTSPDGYLLESNDGINWANSTTYDKGNILAFCLLSNGDLLLSTDEGWVINHTQNTQVKVSNYAIRTVFEIPNVSIICGDDNGNLYKSLDGGESFSLDVSIGYKINIGLVIDGDAFIFTVNGIYDDSLNLLQSGNFTCAYFDQANGFIYAGTQGSAIYRNSLANDFSAWELIWQKSWIFDAESEITAIAKNGNRIGVISKGNIGGMLYTDDYFETETMSSLPFIDGNPNCIVTDNSLWLIGYANKGSLLISTDNAETWTDLGQQFSQTSINCLIATQ